MDRNTHIPGPAGEDNVYVSLTGTQRSGLADNGQNQATSSSGHGSKKSLCHMSKTCEAENVTVEVLKITPSINGETSLLLKDAVGVMKASLTREATRCFGSIHVGDTLVLNKVHIVASGHYNPVRLVCLDDTSILSNYESSHQRGDTIAPNIVNNDMYQFTDSDADQKHVPLPKQTQNRTGTESDNLEMAPPPSDDEIDALFEGLEDPF